MINEKTILLTGEFDEFGKLCTRIIEGEDSFLLNISPVEQIDHTLLNSGSSFKGALESSRFILGPIKMHPIKINESKEIWLVPTKSFKKKSCVWFNLKHVIGTKAHGVSKTEVFMSYGHTFIINMKESAFNNRLQKAQQLRECILTKQKNIKLKRGFQISESDDSIQIIHIKPKNDDEQNRMLH
jgi:competence protein ComK